MDAPKLAGRHASFAVLPDPGADVGAFVRSAVSASEHLSGLDLSLAVLAPQVRLDAGDLTLYPAGPERFLVSVERDGLWQVDEAEARAWSGFAAASGGDGWTCDPGDSAGLKLSYDLYAAGVAKLRWARGLPVAELSFASEEIT
jgi:hypothetical protein